MLLCTFQETLQEFFPSWEQIKVQEEVIVFTCGLMKDPTPLVDHVYETYVEMAYSDISPSGLSSNVETRRQLQAQGKHIGDTNLFNILYTESRVPLFGHAYNNQFVYINETHKRDREINTPSKLYAFVDVSEDDVPVAKFAEQDRGEELPECVLWVSEPDAVAIKNLFSTCCEISTHQPVTHLVIDEVTCKDFTSVEAPALSRNFQAMCVVDSELPTSFWKSILHQLIDNVNLQSLWFENTNLHQLEEDLDELFEHLNSHTGLTNHQVEVVLRENNFSEQFVKKWNQASSGISCKFDDNSFNEDEDDLTLDEINWMSRGEVHLRVEMNLSGENLTTDVVNALEISESVGQLILQDGSISDGAVFEYFLKLFTHNFLTVLDLSGTKLGCNAVHISNIVAQRNMKQLHLPNCEIPTEALDLILLVLPCCTELTHLNLYGNNLESCGHHVAEFILAWDNEPTLKELNLGHCSMTREGCMELLLALGNCKSLTTLKMTANCIQGCLGWFLPQPHEGLHSLGKLFLELTSLNSEDMSHLVQLIEKSKLPMLEELNLGSNALYMMETMVKNLVEACATHHTMKLKVNVGENYLSDSLKHRCKSLCDGTSIELCGITH